MIPFSFRHLEADMIYIPHANFIAASLPRAKGGTYFQMKLVQNHLATVFFVFAPTDRLPLYMFSCNLPESLLRSCVQGACGREANVYFPWNKLKQPFDNSIFFGGYSNRSKIAAVILPSLKHLHDKSSELDVDRDECIGLEMIATKTLEDLRKPLDVDLEREDECGICLEPCTKMVLSNGCHAMCINCYRDQNIRSESCPFCRGSMNSGDCVGSHMRWGMWYG